MPPLDHSPSLNDDQRVRVLWDEFEKWAQSQRKLLERRRANIFYKQTANRKKLLPSQDSNDAVDNDTKQQLEAAAEEHTNMLLVVWHEWMEKAGLGVDSWGTRTDEEGERIARLFQTENAIDRLPPPVQNVYTQPQSPPVYNPAPPMTSAARQFNSSSSTSSSKFVDPSSLSTDDDEADDVNSFQLTTDEFENEYWMPSNVCGVRSKSSTHSSQNASPDHLSSSGSSAYEFLQAPSLSSSMLETHMEPPKRPPDTNRKGKARVRGPAYVGPHLVSSEESSDEDDFTMFRMQTRIDKIWEFHLAAARADVELAITIQNERMSRDSSWDDSEYEARISKHEKRLEELRDKKERERQELVVAERKKRQEMINKRSTLREHARDPRVANAHHQSDWESLFDTSHSVHFDVEKKAFALGSSPSPGEDQFRSTLRLDSHVDVPASALLNHSDIVRTHKQPQSNASSSSSGWKTKHTSFPPVTASARTQVNSDCNSWFDHSAEVSGKLFDFDRISAQNSTPVPPIPAGWGEKSWGEKPSATSLLKKALSDPPSRKHTSLSSVVKPNSDVELNIDHHKSATGFGPDKNPVKNLKGRHFGLFDYDAAAESPTTPTTNTNARGFAGMVSARDILQSRHAHLQADDEMSSTPRPGVASAFRPASRKTNGQDMLSRQVRLPARHLRFDDDEGWGNIHATTVSQEDPQWGMMMHKQNTELSHPKQKMKEGNTWGRGIQGNGPTVAATNQSPPDSELSLWPQQKMKSKVQSSAFTERVPPVNTFGNVPKAEDVEEEFWAAAMAKLQNQSVAEGHSVPEETPWQRMERLKGSLSGVGDSSVNHFDQPPAPPARKWSHSSKSSWSGALNLEHSVADMTHQQPSAPAQSSNKYWTPNGSSKWNDNAQSTAKHSMTMPGGYMSDIQQRYDHFSLTHTCISQGNTRMRSSYTKHPTVEEEPDEDGPGGRDAQVGALPYNSRFILDVAVPKPIRPPEAYSDVIDYGEELDEDNDWDNSPRSTMPTPSTAPTSPPSDMTEEWMNKMTEGLKNGKLDDMDLEFGSFGADISNRTKPVATSSGLPTKQSVWGAQKPETVKLQSAPQSAATSSTTPPKAAPASEGTLASSNAAPVSMPAKTAAAPEKTEPAVKTSNQNQKGKKGKGKGRK
ncbi:hypothetical protein H2248_011688 [Termitomyces sp. 'cryptogamus']|nr:hypothetical protein H2248_011688 [Termitomyces sp. 'cryptogamus']